MTDVEKTFLSLVRLGIGKSSAIAGGLEPDDWPVLEALAEKQGLSAVVIDGLERAPDSLRPPKEILLQWIGSVMQGYEQRYELYRRAIAEMAAFFSSHGIKTMVLKGYACSLDWPKPAHRPAGDIDIWQFGKYKEADALLKEKGISVDASHHHHTVFYWRSFMVENHYDFINVHHHKSHREMECIFKELGQDDSFTVEVNGQIVYIPSPNLHALFLLKHLMLHFASGEISLRQLLDWEFFAEKHSADIDWKWLNETIDHFGMTGAYNIFNAICIEDLGCDPIVFPPASCEPAMKNRVLNDILSPEVSREMPNNVLKRIGFKVCRWRANAWKHRLCYKESLWSAFWSGIWNHLLKPSSI